MMGSPWGPFSQGWDIEFEKPLVGEFFPKKPGVLLGNTYSNAKIRKRVIIG